MLTHAVPLVIAGLLETSSMGENFEGERGLHNVFFVDDHPLVREGLRLLFSETARFEKVGPFSIVGEAENGEEALPQILELGPDLVVTDVRLGEEGMSGIELTHQIQEKCPAALVLIFSAYNDPYYVRKALDAGANGYTLKGQGSKNLGEATRTVLEGERYLDPDLPSA